MLKTLTLLACVLALGGCATLSNIGDSICKHQVSTRVALEAAVIQAYNIVDPVKREATLSSIRVSLAALDTCPSAGV